jgi:hypothetical protein
MKPYDSSISSYYTKMKELWQELDNFSPFSNNNYVDNCNDVTKMREYKARDQMIKFLKGLS